MKHYHSDDHGHHQHHHRPHYGQPYVRAASGRRRSLECRCSCDVHNGPLRSRVYGQLTSCIIPLWFEREQFVWQRLNRKVFSYIFPVASFGCRGLRAFLLLLVWDGPGVYSSG